MRDFTELLADLRRRVDDARAYLQIDAARNRLAELEQQASRQDLWDDQDQARKVTTELARVREDLEVFDGLEERLSEIETLFQLGREEGDDSVEPEIDAGATALSADLDKLELRALFTGEHDERDAICEVHSGAGGTDAQDWTEMLLRMYMRWAERRGFDVELDEVQEGTEAGITSATFIVKGRYAFGLLQGEKGVHRLIRISPFDANARRQTAFASFDAVPALEHTEEPDIDPSDLRIDTYRSSGAGGQHVNVTDSAVRITHVPTGIVVSVQNERSQIQNRSKAMQILAARLAERQRLERQQELASLSGEKKDVAFGSQIRSYTLAPYQLVKDERTRYESGNVQSVLDGELDPFIEAYLQWRRQRDGDGASQVAVIRGCPYPCGADGAANLRRSTPPHVAQTSPGPLRCLGVDDSIRRCHQNLQGRRQRVARRLVRHQQG
jgi:peptide chain release factor 2